MLQGRRRWKLALGTEEPGPGVGLTWVQAHELAALLGVLAVLLATLRPLTQGGHAHLGLPAVAGAAQARVVPLGGEVEAFVHHVVLDVHTRLTCDRHRGLVRQPPGRTLALQAGGAGAAESRRGEEGVGALDT